MALPPPQPLPASPTPLAGAIPVAPSTPAPHRARLQSLEQQIAQLISQRQSAERRHRAEVAELKGVVADLKGRAEEGQGEVGRCRREGEYVRNELIEDHNLYTQRAHLALLAEQIVIEGLKEEIRALTIQSVQRNHKLVRFKHREAKADREFEALEERERLAVAKLGKVRESSARGLEHQAQAELQALEEQLTRQVEETKRVELALRQRDKDERRAQAALREEVQEREEEILRQVEETKRVEQALRLREKELYSLKKQNIELQATNSRLEEEEEDAVAPSPVQPPPKAKAVKKPKAAPAPAPPPSPPPEPVVRPKKKDKAPAPPPAPASSPPPAAPSRPVAVTPPPPPPPMVKKTAVKRKEVALEPANEDDADEPAERNVPEKKKKRKLGGGLLKGGKEFKWAVVEGVDGIPTMLSPVKQSAGALKGGLKGKSLAGRW